MQTNEVLTMEGMMKMEFKMKEERKCGCQWTERAKV